MRTCWFVAASTAVLISCTGEPVTTSESGLDLAAAELIDLTHRFDASTVFWPTAPSRFRLDTLSYGPTEGGFFYSAFTLSTPEHGGTHLDAPIHFAQGGAAVDAIPLDQLVAPAVVLDVSAQAAANRDYLLSVEDVTAFEAAHGPIAPGTIVLLFTGWSRHWPDAAAYLGSAVAGDASDLHFPSFGVDAARLLVEDRRVAALGADVASIDYGPSTDFMVHRIANGAGVPGFENLTNLDRLPPTGAWVIALPMKIGGGSGGPLRAIAAVPRTN
ncbi:MAG: cyclase family protein [Gemmatimonadetes bacterium]|nr:cyclase family protein [Gemmatimonadota bacterium]